MRIIYATDGSDCSRAALEAVKNMTCPIGTEIKVVTVVDLAEPLPVLPDVQEREYAAANELVETAARELQEAHPDAEVTAEVRSGYPIDAMVKLSRNWLADLLIVGSHGRTGISRFWLGSVSRGLLLHAPCAVRIIRQQKLEMARTETNVLICLDESEHSTHLIDHVLALPWKENTRFRCVHVVQALGPSLLLDTDSEVIPNIADSFDKVVEKHNEWVAAAAERINRTFAQKVARGEVLLGDPREKILELSEEWPSDIIMLGSHGRRNFEKLIMGSVSETVALAAKCTVEVTRMKNLRRHGIYLIA
jgi:nucleotide-binding universal stress UspA family protein